MSLMNGLPIVKGTPENKAIVIIDDINMLKTLEEF